MRAEVFDDLLQFRVCRFGSARNHGIDNSSPLISRAAGTGHDIGSMTGAAADFLGNIPAGAIRQLDGGATPRLLGLAVSDPYHGHQQCKDDLHTLHSRVHFINPT